MTPAYFPLISIVVPVFNSEKTIEQCISSICSQTYKNIEVIVIDDGSSDRTGSIIKKMGFFDISECINDKKLKYLRTNNKGVSSARNTGIACSSGEFVFFIDSDDSIRYDAIDILYAAYKKSGASLIIGGFQKLDSESLISNEYNGSKIFKEDVILDKIDIVLYAIKYLDSPNTNHLFVTSWGRLIKMDIIRSNNLFFNEKMKTMEDVEFNFKLLGNISSIYYVSDFLYNYRVYSNASSATTRELLNQGSLLNFIPALEEVRIFLGKNCYDKMWINVKIDNAIVSYAVINLIRLNLQWNWRNTLSIYKLSLSLASIFSGLYSIDNYHPNKSDSKVIPFLIERKFIFLCMLFCKYKAFIRYGKKCNRAPAR